MGLPQRKTLAEILGGGGEPAEKLRDHVGETVTITGYRDVTTRNGPAVQFETEEIGLVWAPSIVADQLSQLAEHGMLPQRLTLAVATSAEGREFFRLVEPDEGADGPSASSDEPELGESDVPPEDSLLGDDS